MIAAEDLEACRAAIRQGSRSFYAASLLMPARVRDPALALYAFCRIADDAVDLEREKAAAVADLRARLAAAYAGSPRDTSMDRACAAMLRATDMPRALPEALLEGFAWDAEGRRYATISELRAYCARVAAAVGAMMTVLMGVRCPDALARACDLGVAMQLTNIARDVGEDAAEGRLFLPLDWMEEAGLDPEAFLADPRPDARLAQVLRRLLAEADRLYNRSEAGVAALPMDCRPGIFAARRIYAAIGGRVAAAGYDSVTQRARTSSLAKAGLMARALEQAAVASVMPRSAVLHAPALPETAFLVEAAARPLPQRANPFLTVFAQLAARDEGSRTA